MRVSGRRTRILEFFTLRHVGVFLLVLPIALAVGSAFSRNVAGSDAVVVRPDSRHSQEQGTVSVATLGAHPAGGEKDGTGGGLPAGTTICAVLTKTIDAKKAKPGDAIVAKTTMAVLSQGKVLIASGAKIAGHITSVRAHSRGEPGSELGIAFDRVEEKEGGEIPLVLTVQAVGSARFLGEGLSAPEPYVASVQNASPSSPQSGSIPTPTSDGRHTTAPVRPPTIEAEPFPRRSGSESESKTAPALDAGSKGVSDLPGLTLTEATGANRGSVIRSPDKNVKLEGGSQLVLRVIAERPEGKSPK